MDTKAKCKAIQDKLGVRTLVTFDDVLIHLRKKHGEKVGNIIACQMIPNRKPLTPFASQEDSVIDDLHSML